jgi:hypothetical protein
MMGRAVHDPVRIASFSPMEVDHLTLNLRAAEWTEAVATGTPPANRAVVRDL